MPLTARRILRLDPVLDPKRSQPFQMQSHFIRASLSFSKKKKFSYDPKLNEIQNENSEAVVSRSGYGCRARGAAAVHRRETSSTM